MSLSTRAALACVVAPFALGSLTGVAHAQCNQNEIANLVPPNCTVVAGDSMAVDGPVFVMGAIGLSCVHVYRHDGVTWNYEQEVKAAETDLFDRFGDAVAVQGNWLMVGATNHLYQGASTGAVHVFEYDGSTWQERDELRPADGQSLSRFGWSLAMEGNSLLVGATLADTTHGADTGAVFVFEESGGSWSETGVVVPSALANGDEFGHAIARDGDTMVVGAYKDDGEGTNAGASYVFRHDGTAWQEEQKLVGSQTSIVNHFGYSVAVDGDDLVIGSRLDNKAKGSAYVFRHDGSTWIEQVRLLASDREDNDEFGTAVAIRDGVVYVGAPQEDTVDVNVGSVYAFRDTGAGWVDLVKLMPSAGLPALEQGTTLLVDEEYVYAGAPTRDPGQAFIYEVADLGLEVSPSTANVGDPVTIAGCGGLPTSLSLLYVVDVNGLGVFVQAAKMPLDSDGAASLNGPVPPSLSGVSLTFQLFGFVAAGQLAMSLPSTLSVP